MSDLLKKYESIDQSKLNEPTIKILDRVKKITVDFTTDDAKNNKIADDVLNEIMKKNPDAIKIVKREPKAKSAPKKAHKAKGTHTAKGTHKTPTASASTPSATKKSDNNIMAVAKSIRKDGETFKEAMERAKVILKEKKEQVIQKKKTELEKLLDLVRTKKELQGFANSDIRRDSVRDAKPRGSRVVTKEGTTSNQYGTFSNKLGRKYWETRDRHADRLAPNYPKDMPLLENGGGVNEENEYLIILQNSETGELINLNVLGNNKENAIDNAYMEADLNQPYEVYSVKKYANGGSLPYMTDPSFGDFQNTNMFKGGGNVSNEEKLIKELRKLQRELNGRRLGTYREGDNSEEEKERRKERESKLARFNEILATLRASEAKFEDGGNVEHGKGYRTDYVYAKEFFENDGLGEDYVINGSFDAELFKTKMLERTRKPRAEGTIKLWSRNLGINPSKYIDGLIIENIEFTNDSTERAKKLFEIYKSSFELGGNIQYDLAGQTGGGSLGVTDPIMLDGFSGTSYTGLVGETGAMSSGELFMDGGAMMQNQQVINDASQPYVITEAFGNPAQHYKNGGAIKNQYEGRTAENVWKNWTEEQRSHFLLDHSELLDNDRVENNLGYSRIVQKDKSFEELTPFTKRVLEAHIEKGQYAKGGSIPNNYEGRTPKDVWDNLTKKQRFHFLSDHEDRFPTFGNKLFDLANVDYNELPIEIKLELDHHVSRGQYAKGGSLKKKIYIKNWYIENYPTDDLGQEINDTATFENLYSCLENRKNVYDVIGVGDSLVRERLFENLAKIKRVPYDYIYEKWLDSDDYASGGSVKKYFDDMTEAEILEKTVVYDNGGKSYDRYTVFTPDGNVYGMDENAKYFNSYLGDKNEIPMGKHLGKKLTSIPKGLVSPILQRMEEEGYAKGGSVFSSKKSRKDRDEELYKLSEQVSEVWDKIGADSGGTIRTDDKLLKAYAEGTEKVMQKNKIKKGSFDREDYDYYVEENDHLLNDFLVFNGYYNDSVTKEETDWRIKLFEQAIKEHGKSQHVANPEIIKVSGNTNSSSKPTKYVDHADIKTVTVNYKGKEVMFKGEDVLNGANLMADGGDLSKIAFYIPKRDVISVQLKNGDSIKPVNGYWIKKGSEPITKEPSSPKKTTASGARFKFDIGDKVMIDDRGYVTSFSEFDLSKPAEIIDRSTTKMGGKTYYFYKVKMADGRVAFNQAEQSKLTLAERGSFADGGLLSSSQIEKLDEGFTIPQLNNMLSDMFPYAFSFEVFKQEQSSNFTDTLHYEYENMVKDNNLKLYFHKKEYGRDLNYEVHQGQENTYFKFLLIDDKIDTYVGTFGFKDKGDVDESYITKFVSFLQDAFHYPLEVRHFVMADGGTTGSGFDPIKVKVVMAVGLDRAIEFYDTEYPIRPYQLLERAVRNGFITLDEINERVVESALETAQDSEDMEEVGSSDETYAMKEFLEEAGFKVDFVNGRLTREFADGGDVAPEEVTINKRNYDVVIMPKTLEIEVQITRADTIDQMALNIDGVTWNQERWGYTIKADNIKQFNKVLSVLGVTRRFDNGGFMEAKNGNNYRYPNREVRVETIDEPIDLNDNVSYGSNEVVIEPINDYMDLTGDDLRAKLSYTPKHRSPEKMLDVNPRMAEFVELPKTISNKHKND